MEIVFATHNPNKLKEVQLLVPEPIKLLSLTDIGCHDEIPETSPTIQGNAIQKANYVTQHYNLPCFADDTGLCVDALHGAPGVYSARYAGEHKNNNDNIDKLLNELQNKNSRQAHFLTVIALNLNNKQYLFEGKCEGSILNKRTGDGGFGYDPVFLPTNYSQSFAQMTMQLKGEISHRGLAIQKLIAFLNA